MYEARSANYGQKIVGIIDSNSAFVSRQDELDDACKKDTKMASQDYEEDDEEEKQRQCEIKMIDQRKMPSQPRSATRGTAETLNLARSYLLSP